MKTDAGRLLVMLSAVGLAARRVRNSPRDAPGPANGPATTEARAFAQGQRLDIVLRAADRITEGQFEASLADRQSGRCAVGESLFGKGLLTQGERDTVLDVQRERVGALPVAGRLLLGDILVATGKITADQLAQALLRQVSTGRLLGDELIHVGHASRAHVDAALLLQRRLVRIALVAAAMLVPFVTAVPIAKAGQSASMQVSASVIVNAKLRSDHQAAQFAITEADVTRGYVDVPAASRFLVSTNSRAGYLLEFHALSNVFESVQITGLGNAVRLGAEGGDVVCRGPLPRENRHELNYRFSLRADAQPGSYPWPLQVSVRPL
jgi:hypothetical protein